MPLEGFISSNRFLFENLKKLGKEIQETKNEKLPEFNKSLNDYEINLGKYCDEITNSVKHFVAPLMPFPIFSLKYLDNELFLNKNANEIAETLIKIIIKYGFIFASAYNDSHQMFDCQVSENLKKSMQTLHYVALAGVKYSENKYYVLIHNSWGRNYQG